MSYFANASVFLVQVLFDLMLTVLWLRFLLQAVGANFYHPLSQLITKLTQPLIRPIQRFFATIKGINTAVLVLVGIVAIVKVVLLGLLTNIGLGNGIGVIIAAIGEALLSVVDLYFFAVLVYVILSWMATPQSAGLQAIIYQLIAPLMEPVRRVIPPIAGFDLTPIPVMIGLKLVGLLVIGPILSFGYGLM